MNIRRFVISALLLAAVVLSGMFFAQSASAAVVWHPGQPKIVGHTFFRTLPAHHGWWIK